MKTTFICITLSLLFFITAMGQSLNQKPKKIKQETNTFINPQGLFDPANHGFSHIAKVPSGSELYYLSGQWASDETGKLVSTDFEMQVRRTIRNIKMALAGAGLTTGDVVKQTIYLVDFTMEKKKILMNVAADEWDAEIFPASTIVPVALLATAPACLIEVETIAAK